MVFLSQNRDFQLTFTAELYLFGKLCLNKLCI